MRGARWRREPVEDTSSLNRRREPKVVLLAALYSERYPALGETHGISVLAGYLKGRLGQSVSVHQLDMVARGRQATEELVQMAVRVRPDIIGVSLTYGTFDYAKEIATKLRNNELLRSALLVFGGPLATFLPDRVLEEVDERAVIVVGEGEESLVALVREVADFQNWRNIPNLTFIDEAGLIVKTARKMVDLNTGTIPLREKRSDSPHSSPQAYTEASRGCTWSACTFCLRGLLDLEGRSQEYRRYPTDRIVSDLRQLSSARIKSVTFADEDLLSGDLSSADHLLAALKLHHEECDASLTVDGSVTIHSVFSSGLTRPECLKRSLMLHQLKRYGLRKVFFGIESGSPTQLRRYAKGHTVEEILTAINTIRRARIGLELGWIMFDPLCTIDEVKTNLAFLLSNDLAQFTSYIFSEMRVQEGSRYLKMLAAHHRRTGEKLYSEVFDPNTLTYPCRYGDPAVQAVVDVVRNWNDRLRPLAYPLKNLTRYGTDGALGASAETGRQLMIELRNGLCTLLHDALAPGTSVTEQLSRADVEFQVLLQEFASAIGQMLRNSDKWVAEQHIVRDLRAAADSERRVTSQSLIA